MTDEIKQRMNIALVGIRPGDQVVLKGYFRVLLRLDVELNWVAATDKVVDLFMINSDFASASSVTKLLEVRNSVPVLYVNRDDAGVGGVSNNTLTIPLKQLGLLNDWLVANIPALSENSAPTPRADDASKTAPKPKTENLRTVVELIKTLQARPKSNFELMDGDKVVAIIDASRQLLWQQGSVSKITSSFYLRPYAGELPETATGRDSAHYLWFLAWHNPDSLMSLVSHTTAYRLRYWAKPPATLRRELLHVMTAIEKEALTIEQIAQKAQVSPLTAKKALVALLTSGHLTEEVYRTLTYLNATPEPDLKIEVKIPERPPVAQSPEQDEKASFLSRLRRKLGI